MNLLTVTLTGADDGTNPEALIELSRKYPFVEWGILVGSNSGGPRWPSPFWFELLKECVSAERQARVKLALHLCGQPLRDVLDGGESGPILPKGVVASLPLFSRVQLNFHGDAIAVEAGSRIVEAFEAKLHRKEAIVQMDGVNNWVLDHLLCHDINASGLFDQSHGAGVLPDSWPVPKAGWDVGYAGGLGPDNVKDQIWAIEQVAGHRPYWIDMETKLRSPLGRAGDEFDLDKCVRVLRIVKSMF